MLSKSDLVWFDVYEYFTHNLKEFKRPDVFTDYV